MYPTRTAEAYARIRARILRCEMEPGARFTEGRLAELLGFAKAPIREALARLVQEGLIRSIPRHGYEVCPVTVGDAKDLFELRLAVEPLATELAAGQIDQAALRRLEDLCETAYDAVDLWEYTERHRELHLIVIRACGNRKLSDVVTRVLDESERLIFMGLLHQGWERQLGDSHGDLVRALARGDGAAARQIAENTIRESQRALVEAVFHSPTLRSAPLGLQSTRGTGAAARQLLPFDPTSSVPTAADVGTAILNAPPRAVRRSPGGPRPRSAYLSDTAS